MLDETSIHIENPTGNYPTAHELYTAGGWENVLPIPPLAKHPPPSGYTGANGRTPSDADVWDWKLYQPKDCNIALRLPPEVIGLDIDQYGSKHGWDNLLDAAKQHGLSPLPPTWRSSAREGPSGIYLYLVPPGTRLRGEAVPDVETIQHHHRFAVVYPSINPMTNTPYLWYPPERCAGEGPVPRVVSLALFPPDWLMFCRDNLPETLPAALPAPAAHREAEWSGLVRKTFDRACGLLGYARAGSRHEIARDQAMALCRMEQNGLAGATTALELYGETFVDLVQGDRGGLEAARAEWRRILEGGRRLAQSTLTAAQMAQRDSRDTLAELVSPEAVAEPEALGLPYEEDASLVKWPTFWACETPDNDYLIEPILARGRAHAIYAAPKVGKSLLMLEIAAACAAGRHTLDSETGELLNVVYFDMEMTENDLRDRLADLGYGEGDDLSRLRYYLLPSLPPLDTEAGGLRAEEIVRHHNADLVVIDTTARVVEGDENSADTFRAFYRHTGSRLKRLGITYARLDHAGKDITKGQRGSSAKADDVDVVWQITPTNEGVALRATHRRMNWIPEKVTLKRETDPLRHVPVRGAYLPGTTDMAARLDALGVPLNTSKTVAGRLLREAGGTASNDILMAALRYRRHKEEGGWL